MKKILLGCAAGIIGAALWSVFGIAYGADLKAASLVKAPTVIMAADPWIGFYLGANAGYGFNLSGLTAAQTAGPFPIFSATQLVNAPQGFTGGLQGGYNFRLVPGSFLLTGIEAEINAGNLTGSAAMPGMISSTSQLNWFGSFGARVGVTIFPNWWLYGFGGLAYGNPNNTFTLASLTGCTLGCATSGAAASTGPAYGVGSEFLLDPSGHWKLGFDWRRYDFGTGSASLDPNGGPFVFSFTPSNRFDVFRARINYTF